jgi:Ala-tRNA(Pro) deacylase
MAIAQTIANYLVDHHVDYHVFPHDYAESTFDAACASNMNPHKVAKAVVIATKGHYKRTYCVVVLPADRYVNMHGIRDVANIKVELAKEYELTVLFPDCAVGAIPALGEAYGLPTFIDESIVDSGPGFFFEAGDHQELIRIDVNKLEDLLPMAEFVSVTKRHFSR